MKSEPTDAVSRPRHPIAVVSERTGLSQDVLRIWERRYHAVAPTRTGGGERLYSDADVERLRLLNAAVGVGRRLGSVAALPTSDLAELVADDRVAKERRAAAARALERAGIEVGETIDAARTILHNLAGTSR